MYLYLYDNKSEVVQGMHLFVFGENIAAQV